MSYDRTEIIEAAMRSRHEAIVNATLAAICKYGVAQVGVREISKCGKFSAGLIYKQFPDIPELVATAIAQLLARDLGAMRLAASREKDAVRGFAAALGALLAQWDNIRLVHAMIGSPVYRNAMRQELDRLLKPTISGARERANAAAAVLGALYGLQDGDGGTARTRASVAVLFALRGIGLTDGAARRVAA